MGQRKKSAAIKSTGATSSKAAPLPDWVKGGGKPPPPSASSSSMRSPDDTRPPPLFPPGTKTPQNLLSERLQKLHKDWNKPEFHPKPLATAAGSAANTTASSDSEANGGAITTAATSATENKPAVPWTCSVTLSRQNPRDKSTNDVIRIVPDDKDSRQRFTAGEVMSKEMARHWGATYVLFRLFSTQSLGLMLPKQFKHYWTQLEAWKKSVPAEQQTFLFAADPFTVQAQQKAEKEARAAKREREEQRKKEARETEPVPNLPKRWRDAKEARMSKSMRDWVEDVVKRASAALPALLEEAEETLEGQDEAESSNNPKPAPKPIDGPALTKQLTTLGFRPGYISSALSWLPRARKAIASHGATRGNYLLQTIATQSDLDAILTYLTLYVPEEDLPSRFKAGVTSESFITTAVAKGKEDGLKLQYALDRLTKGAGYPKSAAEKELSIGNETDVGKREVTAMRRLARRLGKQTEQPSAPSSPSSPSASLKELSLDDGQGDEGLLDRRKDEMTVIESILGTDRVLPLDPNDRPLGFTSSDCFDVVIAGPSRAKIEGRGGTSKSGADEEEWGKEDIRLRVLWKHDSYPIESSDAAPPTFYVTSPGQTALPPYLRLALTQHLLRKFEESQEWKQQLQEGQGGIVLAMAEELESSWKGIVRGDKIKFEEVMVGFTAQPSRSTSPSQPSSPSSSKAAVRKPTAPTGPRHLPPRPILRDFAVDNKLSQRAKAFKSSAQGGELLAARNSLPIARHYPEIVATLANHRLTLLTGSTGSGKTTQLPQFILDSEIEQGKGSTCKIIVTQPRRVSAMSIADRVAHERGERVGDTVGWSVRGERRVGPNNRILFTTTGLLLRRLTSEPDLASVSHLLIDEIHERSLDSDLLLLEVSALLKANPRIKVVLMSATLQKDKYINYFAKRIPGDNNGIGSIDVEGRTHPVVDFYLEDLVQAISFRPSSSSPASYSASRDKAGPLKGLRVDAFNRGLSEGDITAMEVLERQGPGLTPQDYELVGKAVRHVVHRETRKESQAKASGEKDVQLGAVLVFMSGVGEIRQAIDAIRQLNNNPPVEVMPLHSNLSSEEQQRVFGPTSDPLLRKVVVATNVAEASITIDGVTAVVDTGRVKEMSYDPEAGLSRLVEKMTSRASATQRRGRAGRTRPGECWKLFSRTMEARVMPSQGQPEMQRVPLENVVLYALTMGKDDPGDYLSQAVDPPSLASISSAIANLHEAGAIRPVSSASKSTLTTTPLGRHLASLPLDLRLAKLLILGSLLHCLSPLLTIAALMSTTKPLYAASFEQRDALALMRAREAEARGTRSDLLTDAALYEEYVAFTSKPTTNSAIRNKVAKQFVESHFLSQAGLREVANARGDLLRDVMDIGFAPHDYKSWTGHEWDEHAGDMGTLRALLAASLWPQVVRVAQPEARYQESSSGAIAKDPEARQVRLFSDPIGTSPSSTSSATGGRVFLHPSSVLFSSTKIDSSHLAVWRKSDTSKPSVASKDAKVFLRDATEVPVYALLLFCGRLKVHAMMGGISVLPRATGAIEDAPQQSTAGDQQAQKDDKPGSANGSTNGSANGSAPASQANSRPTTPATAPIPPPANEEGSVRIRAPARIAVLSAQLRRLLDAHLAEAFEQGQPGHESPFHHLPLHQRRQKEAEAAQGKKELMDVLRALLERDGMGKDSL